MLLPLYQWQNQPRLRFQKRGFRMRNNNPPQTEGSPKQTWVAEGDASREIAHFINILDILFSRLLALMRRLPLLFQCRTYQSSRTSLEVIRWNWLLSLLMVCLKLHISSLLSLLDGNMSCPGKSLQGNGYLGREYQSYGTEVRQYSQGPCCTAG